MRREQLDFLIEINKCSSIYAASDKLHISSQALGASIRSLEKELGMELLVRSHTGVTLTDNAREVIRLARSFWQGIDELTADNAPPFIQEELEIYASYSCVAYFIPYMIKEFADISPGAKYKIHEIDEAELIAKIKNREIPYALTMYAFLDEQPFEKLDDTLKFVPFSISRLYAMVPKGSPLAKAKQLSLKTLAKQPLLLYSPCQSKDKSIYPLLKRYVKPHDYEIQYNHIVYKTKLVTGSKIGLTFTSPLSDNAFFADQNYKNFMHNVPLKENIYMYAGYITLKDETPAEVEALFQALNLSPIALNNDK